MHDSSENLKEMHLKKIKPKTETKPILQSLRDGIEQLKKTTVRERSETRQASGNGFLERISKLTQGNRSRNPAKKSASFTFAIRPELAMKAQERYSSLEPEASQSHSSSSSKQPVQRSVSTSVLEVSADIEVQPNYSRVRDSLTPLPSPPKQTKPKAEDIYAEICEDLREIKPEVQPKSNVQEGKIVKTQIQRQSRVQVKPQIRRETRMQRKSSEIPTKNENQPQILPRLRIDNESQENQPQIPPRFRIDNESSIENQPQIFPRFKIENQSSKSRVQTDIQPQIQPRFQTECQPQIQPRFQLEHKPHVQPRFQTENQSQETESQIRIESKSHPQIQPRYQIETEPQIHPRFHIHPDYKNSGSHVKARIKIIVKSKESYENEQAKKEGRYINSVMITHSDPIINSSDDIIYNSIY